MFISGGFESTNNPLNNREQGKRILTIPPCQNENEENFSVQKCCKLLASTHKNTNIQQIMSLMKYSLDLSNPWITQYFKKQGKSEIGLNANFNRFLSKFWLKENKDSVMELFARNGNVEFPQSFG